MLSCFIKKPLFINNNSLADYCMKSTQESIKRMVEKNDLKKKNEKMKNILNEHGNSNNNNNNKEINFYRIIAFLSISSLAFLYYKRIK